MHYNKNAISDDTKKIKDREGNYYTDARQIFWTSGSDIGTEGVHKWCYPAGVNQPIQFTSLISWKVGAPDNYLTIENCDAIVASPFDVNPLKLSDIDCNSAWPYICEVFKTV
jgi:hypothetical protein